MNPSDLFYNSVKESTEMWKAEAEKWFQKRSIEIFEEEIKLRIDAVVDSLLKDDNFHKDTLIEIQNYMMDKQVQDERWKALTEDGRQARIASYKELLKLQKEEANSYLITIEDLEKLYGKHNLNPKPQIKTWEDIVAQAEWDINSSLNKIQIAWIGYPICDKMIATAKIVKLIEFGYGGMVSEEEYDTKVFWNIVANRQDKKAKLNIVSNYDAIGNILTFRSYELAYEFMSHESNRKLVEQYYLL